MKVTLTTDASQSNANAAKDRASAVAQSVQSGLAKTQDTVQTGLSTAQDVLQSGLDVVQDAWTRNVKKANKNLKKAGKSIKGVQGSVQDQLASYARKRRRAKMLFRLGLLVGVMLAFLYTPWPGADVRRRLSAWWQQVLAAQPVET